MAEPLAPIEGFISSLGDTFQGLTDMGQMEALVLGAVFLAFILLIVYYVYKNYDRVLHNLRLRLRNLFFGGMRLSVLGFLMDRKYLITVRAPEGRTLGTAHIVDVQEDKLSLRFLESKGGANLERGDKIVCHFRPIWFFYMRSNSFTTYVMGRLKAKKFGTPSIRLKMPVAVEDVSRRRFKRKRIRTQRVLMARLWFKDPVKGGGGRFLFSKANVQVNVDYHVSKRNTERVFDVSGRGIRLGVHQHVLGRKQPLPGEDVCLEVKPFIRKLRKFDIFLFGGKIRHVYRTPADMVVIGVEFTLVGKRTKIGEHIEYDWQDIAASKVSSSFMWAIRQL